MTEELREFFHKYGELLDTNQTEFFDVCEDILNIENYKYLVDMIKDAGCVLKPELIFDGYDDYKIAKNMLHLNNFIDDNFTIEGIKDFNGFNIKDLKDKSTDLIHQNIYIKEHLVGDVEVAETCFEITYEDNYSIYKDGITNQLIIRFYDKRGRHLTSFIYYLDDLEDLFNIFKVVPNYGIGWNKVYLEESRDNFIQTLKDCLGIS